MAYRQKQMDMVLADLAWVKGQLKEQRLKPATGFMPSLVHSVFAQSEIDGMIKPGDVLVCMGVAVGESLLGGGCGLGVRLILQGFKVSPGFDPLSVGLGLGALVGSVLAGWRLASDLSFTPQEISQEQEGQAQPQAPAKKGHLVVVDRQSRLPDNWHDLNALNQKRDILYFATYIWRRQQLNMPCGQKEFRGLNVTLPSGFRVTDKLHSTLLAFLDDRLEAISKSGNQWKLGKSPDMIEKELKAW